jgi:membrane fusion protein (multidrug efflux system)
VHKKEKNSKSVLLPVLCCLCCSFFLTISHLSSSKAADGVELNGGQMSTAKTAVSSTPSVAAPDPAAETMGASRRVQLIPVQKTVLSSMLAGSISVISVREGERFKKGLLLFQIGCEVQISALNKAKAVHGKMTTLYETAKKLMALNTRSALDVSVAEAEANEAAAHVALMQTMVNRCRVYAPFSGIAGQRFVDEHQYVSEGQALMEIINDRSLELEFIVPSSWVMWLVRDYAFTVTIDENNQRYDASIVRIGGKIDPVSRSIKVYGKIKGEYPELIPGMSGVALFTLP